jgi:2-amino-4-hydroxy-6-hydroxymethyldihydropteridine diphosphokinase
MARAWIALGSNLGAREDQLQRALSALATTPQVRVLRRSKWFETAPVGGPAGQGPYLNGVAQLSTTLAARDLLERMLAIEASAGRRRSVRDAPRTLDLDLLLYDDLRLDEPRLVLPHPRMEERIFVLAPLAELEPELVLPAQRQDSARAFARARGARALSYGWCSYAPRSINGALPRPVSRTAGSS